MRSASVWLAGLCLVPAACIVRMGPTDRNDQAIAALRRAYAAFNRGDIDAAIDFLDPEAEWTEPASFPHGDTYHGHAGVKDYLTRSRAGFTEGGSEPERFIAAGDRIVVFVHARVLPKDGSQWREIRLADVFTFRNGKVVHMEAYADRGEALRAVGIAEPASH